VVAPAVTGGRSELPYIQAGYCGGGVLGALGAGGIGIFIFDIAIIAFACCQPYQARLRRKNARIAHQTDPAINPTIPKIAPPTRPITLAICRLRNSPNGNQSKPRTICPPSSGKTGSRLKMRSPVLIKFRWLRKTAISLPGSDARTEVDANASTGSKIT